MAYDEDLADRVRVSMQHRADVREKKMFGGLAFLLGGHMAVAVGGRGGLMVRCDPSRTAELVQRPGASPMQMRGREMRGWLHIEVGPADDSVEDSALGEWVDLGADYAGSLPPK